MVEPQSRFRSLRSLHLDRFNHPMICNKKEISRVNSEISFPLQIADLLIFSKTAAHVSLP